MREAKNRIDYRPSSFSRRYRGIFFYLWDEFRGTYPLACCQSLPNGKRNWIDVLISFRSRTWQHIHVLRRLLPPPRKRSPSTANCQLSSPYHQSAPSTMHALAFYNSPRNPLRKRRPSDSSVPGSIPIHSRLGGLPGCGRSNEVLPAYAHRIGDGSCYCWSTAQAKLQRGRRGPSTTIINPTV